MHLLFVHLFIYCVVKNIRASSSSFSADTLFIPSFLLNSSRAQSCLLLSLSLSREDHFLLSHQRERAFSCKGYIVFTYTKATSFLRTTTSRQQQKRAGRQEGAQHKMKNTGYSIEHMSSIQRRQMTMQKDNNTRPQATTIIGVFIWPTSRRASARERESARHPSPHAWHTTLSRRPAGTAFRQQSGFLRARHRCCRCLPSSCRRAVSVVVGELTPSTTIDMARTFAFSRNCTPYSRQSGGLRAPKRAFS